MKEIKSRPMVSMQTSSQMIEYVTGLKPGLAVFDCDGTLWSGDVGERFFDWELRNGVFPDETVDKMRRRYAEYKAGKVSEDDMCGEMVTLHRGMREKDVLRISADFFEGHFVQQIFSEMRELIGLLQDSGCDVWAVSSTNEWTIREAMKHYGIPADRILAALSEVEDGVITDRLVRVPSGAGKPKGIRKEIGRDPDVAFGNSRWDADMLRIAKYAIAVNPNPDLEQTAHDLGWAIYRPQELKASQPVSP
jgi:phosphoserine phosphatase